MELQQLRESPIGELVPAYKGEWAFVPQPLPRQLALDPAIVFRLDQASRSAATLAGVGETIVNPHLLIRPFLRREAVLSSMIEGTQASISDLFLYEASSRKSDRTGDTREVANYVVALEHGLERLPSLPLGARLMNEMHEVLMTGVRGHDQRPGALRTEQVWIGSEGTGIGDARFVPPPPDRVPMLISDLERFIHDDNLLPPLVRCALMHYQFEVIHPYFDGNGRLGRLLIVLFLCEQRVLPKPLLYLSAYFERNRIRYYDELFRLSASGDWNSWLDFFLTGVEEQSQDALARSRRLRELQARYREEIMTRRGSANALRLADILFESPFMTPSRAASMLDVTYVGAKGVLERLRQAGIVSRWSDTGPNMYVAREILRTIDAPVVSPDSP